MTQLDPIDGAGTPPPEPKPARNGIFLVKSASGSHVIPASQPRIARRSRSLGLLALAGAALAAPLLWLLHAAYVSLR